MSRGTYLLTHSSSYLLNLSEKKNKASSGLKLSSSEKSLVLFCVRGVSQEIRPPTHPASLVTPRQYQL